MAAAARSGVGVVGEREERDGESPPVVEGWDKRGVPEAGIASDLASAIESSASDG